MAEIRHDVLILGAGLAGLRAAVEIARRLRRARWTSASSPRCSSCAPTRCAPRAARRRAAARRGRLLRPARLGHGQGLRLPRRPGRRPPLRRAPCPRRSCCSTTGASPGRATRTAASTQRPFGGHSYPAGHAGRRQDRLLRDADALRHAAALPLLHPLRRALRHRHPGRGRTIRRAWWASTRRSGESCRRCGARRC